MRIQTLIATAAVAATTTGAVAMGPLDRNGDGMLTEREFAPIAAKGAVFERFDSNSDGLLSEPEYNEGIWAVANRDMDTTDLDLRDMKRRDWLTRAFHYEVEDLRIADRTN